MVKERKKEEKMGPPPGCLSPLWKNLVAVSIIRLKASTHQIDQKINTIIKNKKKGGGGGGKKKKKKKKIKKKKKKKKPKKKGGGGGGGIL